MHGELQEGCDQDISSMMRLQENTSGHDEKKPRSSDGNVDLVAGWMHGARGGDAVGDVATTGLGLGSPFVESDAQVNSQNGEHDHEDVHDTMTGRKE